MLGKIYITDEFGQPLPCTAECTLYDEVKSLRLQSDTFGCIELPNIENTMLVKVRPFAHHWKIQISDPQDGKTYKCPSINEDEKNWWYGILGIQQPMDADGIKIGVVDIGMKPSSESQKFKHIKHYDESEPSDQGHGFRVSSVLSNDIPMNSSGVCKKAQISFYDTTPPSSGISALEIYDVSALVAGISYLATIEQVDLICISAGIYDDIPLPSLQNAIDAAHMLGVLCICAAGNRSQSTICAPARFHNTIAVGGVGKAGYCPPDSYAGNLELRSIGESEWSHARDSRQWFPCPITSYCGGVDVVAPSMGIILTFSDNFVTDLEGTSYACPIVVGMLALVLSKDDEYRSFTGESKANHARQRLLDMARDVNIDKEKQGAGVPVLG